MSQFANGNDSQADLASVIAKDHDDLRSYYQSYVAAKTDEEREQWKNQVRELFPCLDVTEQGTIQFIWYVKEEA